MGVLCAQTHAGKLSERSRRETSGKHHNHHRKDDRNSKGGRIDPRLAMDFPKTCGPRHKLESYQSVANERAVVGITIIIAEASSSPKTGAQNRVDLRWSLPCNASQ